MSLKEMVIQEIENASEPLLEEVLKFIYSHQDPVIAHLNKLREQGEYADDVSEDELNESDSAYKSYLEGNEKGTTLDDLEIELFGEKL
jgi:hypothetical protein